jgi:aryl-alcohol dehydrogenase-like predicted oxidoreductase
MNFGWQTDEKESFRIMDMALASGINFFDTANSYGGSMEERGTTEKTIGQWFRQGDARRDKIILATKVYASMPDSLDTPNETAGLSAYKVRRHLDASLRRLQTDHVELYQMHHIDTNVTWDELWEVFGALLCQGKIVYVGSSNFAAWQLVQSQNVAKLMNLFGLVSEQHKYNLLCRLPELEILPACKALGIGLIVYSPLHRGLLGGNAFSSHRIQQIEIQKYHDKLVMFSKLCKELGLEESKVALKWLLSNVNVTSVIIGPRTAEQFEKSLQSLEITLDDEAIKKLDEIFPGPGGAAPKAYAW